MLERLSLMVESSPSETDRAVIEREVAGVAALLTNHLAYEERVLVAVLDATAAAGADLAALRAPVDRIFEPPGPDEK